MKIVPLLLPLALTSYYFSPAYAELQSLDDSSLSDVHGQNGSAIGYILDDVYITGKNAELTLDFDSGIPLVFTNFYWVGHNSPISGEGVYGADVGSYEDSFFINTQEEIITLENGETIGATTLVAAFPEGNYKAGDPDSGKMDLGALMTLEHASGNIDETWLIFNGMDLDGTYLKYWAPEGGGLAVSGEINFSADDLIFQTASVNGQPSNDLTTAWNIADFELYLPIGHSLYQPATLKVNEEQHLVFEIEAITENSSAQFYSEPTGYLNAGNITLNNWDSGTSYIEGLQIQHLKIETHNLESSQSVIEVSEVALGEGTNGADSDKSFTRITLGMDIDINANIDRLVLGEGDRQDGADNSNGTATADIDFSNISLGTIDSNGNMQDLEISDPYFEFARNSDGNLIGFRLGFGEVNGVLGSEITTLSGDIEAVGELLFLDLDSSAHNIREDQIEDDLLGIDIDLANFKTLKFTETKNLYLGLQSEAINYPRINEAGSQGQAQAGFWLNLQDGATAPNLQLNGLNPSNIHNTSPNNHYSTYF